MKVFCSKCKFFRRQYVYVTINGSCGHSDNLEENKGRDTWCEEGKRYNIYIRPPSEINALNDCRWFQPKED